MDAMDNLPKTGFKRTLSDDGDGIGGNIAADNAYRVHQFDNSNAEGFSIQRRLCTDAAEDAANAAAFAEIARASAFWVDAEAKVENCVQIARSIVAEFGRMQMVDRSQLSSALEAALAAVDSMHLRTYTYLTTIPQTTMRLLAVARERCSPVIDELFPRLLEETVESMTVIEHEFAAVERGYRQAMRTSPYIEEIRDRPACVPKKSLDDLE